jgi:hypothetical protein
MDHFLRSHMKSMEFAKRLNSRTELINGIRDATDQTRNDKEMLMRAVMLTVERAQMCVDNQVGHFEKVRRM